MVSRAVMLALAVILPEICKALPALPPSEAAAISAHPRQLVVISDLHFGVGKRAEKDWYPYEDFRWPIALKGFLNEIDRAGNQEVDLVIAGDFFELWQPPQYINCDGGTDAKCSVKTMAAMTQHMVGAHSAELNTLADFAEKGNNKLYIVPGNHDAALLVPEVWSIVAKALRAEKGRVDLVSSGIYSTPDGSVVVEHGHQIGIDVNAFTHWPQLIKRRGGKDYIESPWGERFVQTLFNKKEKSYPIIDNLSPEAAGARLMMEDLGAWGSAVDMARFVKFNLFDTTPAQKLQSLGSPDVNLPSCTQDQAKGLGYRFFTEALPVDDELRKAVEANSPQAKQVQAALTALARSLPDDELADICSKRADNTLGATAQHLFVRPENVMRRHLEKRIADFPDMKVFVYAHTHLLEEPWKVGLGLTSSVTVLNTGAFQRLIDLAGYDARVKKMKLAKRSDGLSKISLESLAPCYSFVRVGAPAADGTRQSATLVWKMDESQESGAEIAAGDISCQ